VAIVTRTDLAAAVEFSWETAYNNIQAVRPRMPVFQLSAKSGEGMRTFLDFLSSASRSCARQR
jgi:hydrogenase nickel incorporation protein HypB